ncbi:Hypothetical predicted protein [Lecanosticta acicola]|uniref:Uncharacterized protein n=1 Tax=Lecanosticta acicola TaxID=111012 RepID=A0AAI8YWJ8_9PEZI|nr:Hypothetical predicted protein [Lecanosticta acicola]
MSSAQTSDMSLTERVQALPAELFNRVLDYTFTLSPSNNDIVEVTKAYKPPAILQIDRASRAKLMGRYYDDKIFTLDVEDPGGCVAWIHSLTSANRQAILQIRLDWLQRDKKPKFDDAHPTVFHASRILHKRLDAGVWLEVRDKICYHTATKGANMDREFTICEVMDLWWYNRQFRAVKQESSR